MADAYLDMKTITGLSGGDYNMNKATPGSFAPGQVVFLHAATGLVVLTLVRNTHSSDINQSDLVRKLATSAHTDVTTTTPRTEFTTSGLSANYYVGAIAYVVGDTDAPGGEYGIVVANSATHVVLDPNRPFSADLESGTDDITLYPTYQSLVNDTNDRVTSDLQGVAIGEDGIDSLNFGFTQCFGICPIVRRSTTLSAGDMFVSSDSGDGGTVTTHSAGDNTDIIVGKAISAGPNTDSDHFIGQIACGPMALLASADTV